MFKSESQAKEGSFDITLMKKCSENRRGQRDMREMREASKLLNGPAWSTEGKYMRRYKGTIDVFFGFEHRMRKEEQFNNETQQGWRFAADAAMTRMQAVKIANIRRIGDWLPGGCLVLREELVFLHRITKPAAWRGGWFAGVGRVWSRCHTPLRR